MAVAVPASIYQTKFLTAPWGGVNNSLPDEAIADSEWADSANYQPDRVGGKGICKRLGLTKHSTVTSASILSIYQGKLNNYVHSGNSVYKSDMSTAAYVTGLSTSALDSWSSYGGYDFFVNGTDAQKTSNGTSFSAISNIPSGAKYVASVNNFVYCAGHSHGSLRYASLGTLETWPATNELVLTQDENDDIAGLAPTVAGVLVMCSKSFYVVVGYSDLDQQVSYYSKQEGATSFRSIVVTPYGNFFWSKSGLVWMKADYSLDYPMLRKLAGTLSGLNRAKDSLVRGVWDAAEHRVRYWLFNGNGQATENLLMDYYPEFDAFFLHTGALATTGTSAPFVVSGAYSTYVGGLGATTYVYTNSGATDDGSSISAYAEMKREAYGNSNVLKRGRIINLTSNLGTAGTVTYKCYVDNETSVDSANTWAMSVGTGIVDNVIGLNRTHWKIKHRIEDALAQQTFFRQLQHDGYVVRTR